MKQIPKCRSNSMGINPSCNQRLDDNDVFLLVIIGLIILLPDVFNVGRVVIECDLLYDINSDGRCAPIAYNQTTDFIVMPGRNSLPPKWLFII